MQSYHHCSWQVSSSTMAVFTEKNNTQDLAKNPLTQGRHCGPTLCPLGNLRIVRCCRCHSLIVDRTVNTFIYQIWKLLSVTYVVSGFNDNATMNVKWTSQILTVVTLRLSMTGAFWLYTGMGTMGFLFLFFLQPETKGRTLEEMEDLFMQPWCSERTAPNNWDVPYKCMLLCFFPTVIIVWVPMESCVKFSRIF